MEFVFVCVCLHYCKDCPSYWTLGCGIYDPFVWDFLYLVHFVCTNRYLLHNKKTKMIIWLEKFILYFTTTTLSIILYLNTRSGINICFDFVCVCVLSTLEEHIQLMFSW